METGRGRESASVELQVLLYSHHLSNVWEKEGGEAETDRQVDNID